MERLPLEGIRVADFTMVVVGPLITQWLAVMGAEVIKVESAQHPDGGRTTVDAINPKPAGLGLTMNFATLNYSKKSVTLNLTQPKAIELAKKLVKVSDVVTENFGGPVMDRRGLGYADLKKIKPDIIMVATSGFGRTGPLKESPALAPIIDAFSGQSSVNGYLGGEPSTIGVSAWTDWLVGQNGAFVILAALYHHSQTGEGQYIDLSMSEAGLASFPELVMAYTMNEKVAKPMGNRDEIMAPHGCYRCQGKDKWVAIAISNQGEWNAFCHAIGNPEWTKREEFSDELSRWKNQEKLDKFVSEWTKKHTHYEVMERLQRAGVMAGASLDMEDTANNPHLRERDFFVDIEHPEVGKLPLSRLPWKLSDTPAGNYQHTPMGGEHNDYVFGELLGMSREEIKQLVEEKVIY